MIQLTKGRFTIDGKPEYIYSGEIHYFRIDPKLWPLHLERAKEAGLNTVSTYIPWSWHEPKEGKFDFTGRTHPQRNLVAFIQAVRKAGLKMLVRVGPVSNAELQDEGIPAWLLEDYPEVYTRGREVTNLPHVTLLCYLNEVFQRFVGRWYDHLLPIIRKNQWPNGNVILVQLDNEIGMIRWLNKAADYSPYTDKLYRDFIERKYKKIRLLNAAYSTSYGSFSELKQPPSGSDSQNRNLLWDWMAFYQHYYALYFETLYRKYRAHGLKLPVLANIPQFYDFDVRGRGVYSPMTTMMFKDFPKVCREVIFGGAYQMRRLDYENFHDIVITTEVVKMITTPGVPTVCAELQTGIMRDRPRLYPQDVELNLKTCTAHGLNAVNCYMFSGGKNVWRYGGFGTYHEWQAPVNSRGGKQEHFRALEQFGSVMKSFGTQISSTEKQTDTAVGFYAPYYTTEYLSGPFIEEWEWKKMQLFYDGLARLLQLAHLNYTFVDIQKASLKELAKHRSLWAFSLELMDEATQKKLAAYVKQGGNLILNPYLPEADLAGKPCSALADFLGTRRLSSRKKPCLVMIGKKDYLAQGDIHNFKLPPGSRVAATDIDGSPCAFRLSRGAGTALLLGFGLNHMFDYHVELVAGFAASLGIRPSILVDKDLQAVLRSSRDRGFLFIANFHDEPRRTTVTMTLPGEKKPSTFPAHGSLSLAHRRCYVLPLNVPLTSVARVRYSTAEIVSFSEEDGALLLTVCGAADAEAEIDLKTSASTATIDGGEIRSEKGPGSLRINFSTNGSLQTIRISR